MSCTKMKHKKSRSLSSAEIIAGNDDLLIETILLRLPAKTLIRLQSVCKHWQSLISSPSFSRLHTRRHCTKPQISFIFSKHPTKFFMFTPPCNVLRQFHFNSPYTRILQSCNGLLLLESRNSKYGRVNYSVYNPSTKQSRVLVFGREERVSKVFLAFDPSVSVYYSIVCIYWDMVYQVLDSETWEWTSIENTPYSYNPKSLFFINTIYWKNKLNWIKQSNHMYLDLQKREVGFAHPINTPCRKRDEIMKRHIMESNGHVHCVTVYLRPKTKRLLVFELLDDDSHGWFELHKVDLNPIAASLPEMNNDSFIVLGIVRGETEQESSVLLHVPGKVFRYRFCDGEFVVVLDLTTCEVYEEGRLQFRDRHTFQFIESLAPV